MAKAPKGSKQAFLNKALPIFDQVKLGDVVADLINVVNTSLLTKPGLAISASTLTAQAVSAFVAMVQGSIVSVAAATPMPAIAGTIPTGDVACWAFSVAQNATLSVSAMTTPAATQALAIAALAAQFQTLPQETLGPQAVVQTGLIGFITVSNASGSNFVAGTTALNASNITTTYYDNVGTNPFTTVVNLESRQKY